MNAKNRIAKVLRGLDASCRPEDAATLIVGNLQLEHVIRIITRARVVLAAGNLVK